MSNPLRSRYSPTRLMSAALVLVALSVATQATVAQSLLGGLSAPDQPQLLEPEKAFAVDVEKAPSGLRVTWRIADDYYMYGERFAITTTTPGVTVGELNMPPGKVKSDPTFGDVETYSTTVQIKAPVSLDKSGPVNLKIMGQGCNEPVGVCYPPIAHEITLDLETAIVSSDTGIPDVGTLAQNGLAQGAMPASDPVPAVGAWGTPEASSSSSVDSLSSLNALLGGDAAQEFLDVEDAFQLTLTASDPNTLSAQFVIADGYYLYQDQVKFKSKQSNVRLQAPIFPKGKLKDDEFFGQTTVFYKHLATPVAMVRGEGAIDTLEVDVVYQGCAEDGICYPPVEKTLSIALPALISSASADGGTGASATPSTVSSASAPTPTNSAPESSRFANKGFWALLLTAFGIGILLTFTPCVLPLIPILTSVIAGQGEQVTRMRGGMLAAIYVLGTAVTYAAMGYVAGATGDQLQAYFQNAWAIGILVTIFVIMALSMFGLFTLQMPGFLQSRLQGSTQNVKGGNFGGVFLLGLVSALIVGACVSPLLISALSVAIARGDAWLGAAMMFSMALGMGVFLILIGFGAGFLLPRAGMWMDRVTQGFGVMMLAVAIYMLGAFPQVPVLLLWAALLIVVAVYLGATQSLPEGATGLRIFAKGVGTVLLVWGIAAMLGGFAGNRDLMNPLPKFTGALVGQQTTTGSAVSHDELFTRVANEAQLDAALAKAQAAGKMVLLDYYADWCRDCLRMEQSTLVSPQVKPILDSRFVMLQVDVTDSGDADGVALKKRFGVFGPPAILFFDKSGQELVNSRLYGFRDAKTFAGILNGI